MSKPIWVLDTNVVLDCLHFADPAVLPILYALEAGKLECRASSATLEELRRVLAYPALGLDVAAQAATEVRYRALVHCVEAARDDHLPRCRDTDDQKFLELAATGATVLVSKDGALLKLARRRGLGFRILSPTQAAAALVDAAFTPAPARTASAAPPR